MNTMPFTHCDELGLLVWQDFAFACMDYPDDDPVLRAEVEQEAAHQVRRLRNHACLALWCGNNEVQMIHVMGYRDLAPGGWGSVFFDKVLPAARAAHGGGVPYWPGSPYGESADGEDAVAAINGVLDGDRHAWEVWHGLDFGAGGGEFASVESRHYRRYAADRGKFISEFGIHASPELATLQRWLPKDQLQVHSPGFDHHNKDHPKNKHDPVLEIVTGLPSSIEQYVDFTMISQAEGLKFGIEHYRRREPHCGGTLIWQFNDVWPGFSWSVIDYAGVPKAGYHYARRPSPRRSPASAKARTGAAVVDLQQFRRSCLLRGRSDGGRFSAVPDLVAGVATGGPDRPRSPGPYPAARTSRPRIAMPGYAVQTAHSTLTGASSARSKMWNSVSARLSPRSSEQARIEPWFESARRGSTTLSEYARPRRRCGSQTTT